MHILKFLFVCFHKFYVFNNYIVCTDFINIMISTQSIISLSFLFQTSDILIPPHFYPDRSLLTSSNAIRY